MSRAFGKAWFLRRTAQAALVPMALGVSFALAGAASWEKVDEAIARRDLAALGIVANINSPAEISELELRIIRHWDDRPISTVLLKADQNPQDANVVTRVLADVGALARHRALRRRECRMVVEGPGVPEVRVGNYGSVGVGGAGTRAAQQATKASRSTVVGDQRVPWHFSCRGQGPDDPLTDLDGLPPEGSGAPARRDLASLAAVAHVSSRPVAAQLAPLLADLSWLPKQDNVAQSPAVILPRTQVPLAVLGALLREGIPAEPGLAATLLYAVDAERFEVATPNYDPRTVPALMQLLMFDQSRRNTEIFVEWLRRMARVHDHYNRQADEVARLVPVLGPVVPHAQVDLAAVEADVLRESSPGARRDLQAAFARAREDNASLSAPSADSIVYWMIPVRVSVRTMTFALRHLLSQGADPNGAVLKYTARPLQAAAAIDISLVRLLLDRGADVNGSDSRGIRPLHAAFSQRTEEARVAVASLLVAQGADVRAATNEGTTPLHFSVTTPQALRDLLARGAPVDAADVVGATALTGAVRVPNLASIEALLAAGANPNHEFQFRSPYREALERKDPTIVAMLERYGGKLSTGQLAYLAKERESAERFRGLFR